MTQTPTRTGTATDTELEASIDIAAAPATVWALVTDLPAMSRRSPQVLRTFVLGGRVGAGSRFVNVNHRGPLCWPTTAKVVRFAPHHHFAFRVAENRVVWSFSLSPTADGGTHLVERRETPDGISALSKVMTAVALGGQDPFVEDLTVGMRATLEALKAEAESRP